MYDNVKLQSWEGNKISNRPQHDSHGLHRNHGKLHRPFQ